MTTNEQKTVQQISLTQATMKEHQRNMQNDIDELKRIAKEVNQKLDTLTSTIDNLSGGKQALMWVTGISLSIAALVAAYINVFKEK